MVIDSRRISRSLVPALFLAAAAGIAGAEDGAGGSFPELKSALPAEAPTSVFDAKLGSGPDADAELFVSGSWSSTLIGSLDYQASPGSPLSLVSAQPILYTQDPDLALSFLLYKHIFVEAKVSQTVSEAKYAAGYRGGDDEVLKELRIGNDGINFPTLPFLSFGNGSYRSFGLSALVGNGGFSGKAMVRYDQASRVTKRFVGSTEVTEAVLAPSSFISGKYFMTFNRPNGAVEVYVQSSSGSLSGSDGDKYRKLDASEYSYSGITGVVSLSATAQTKVLAYYPGGSGSPSSGNPVTIGGTKACDLLYEPPSKDHETATINPRLQALCRYPTTATPSTGEAFVRNKASGLRDNAYQAEINDKGFVEVTQSGLDPAKARESSSEDAYRKPFGATSSADMEWIYTTDFAADTDIIGSAPVYTRSVVVRTFASAANITIDKDFVAGSIEVTRNGVPDYSFSVDADTGILTLASPPAASEEIVVTYLKESEERKTGIVVGALGGFWDLGEGRSAWVALGAAWSLPGSSYSSGEDSRPGSLNLAGGGKDAEGALKSDAAIALRYSRDDSTGIYRVEGMESTSQYSTSFRQLSGSSGYRSEEKSEDSLDASFPSIVKDFHRDGSTQKALRIVSDGLPAASFYKIEDAPAYPSYKTFAFFAKLPPGASLTVMLDEGRALSPTASAGDLDSASVGVVVPADPTRKGDWDRYVLHYGKDDSSVYRQDDEDSSEARVYGAASRAPSIKSTGSRLVVAVAGLAPGEEVWIDEVVLEDSVGRAAFLFQGKASFDDPELSIGGGAAPIVSRIKADAFAQGAIDSDPYASGGGSVAAALGFVGLALRARTTLADRSATFSGGHSIELPNESFPIAIKDEFDFDPTTGAFGRADALSLRAGGIASLTAKQESDWTPDSSIADAGVLVQSWDNSLVFGPSYLTLGLAAKNRALPSSSPSSAEAGRGYAAAWIEAFDYALPAFESSSDLREAKGSLSVKIGQAEYLAASLGETTTPEAGGAGTRSDAASARIAFPFPALGLDLEPYYSRSWKDQRGESGGSLVEDARAAMRDIAETPLVWRSVPFREIFDEDTASDFAAQSAPAGAALPAASYQPEMGLKMARESGSRPIDILAPDAVAVAYGRSLSREADSVTDASVWRTSLKSSAVNVFGSMGSHPLGLPFDSDEYMATLQADLSRPRDGSSSSYDVQYHGLSTFYAGPSQENKLDAESKVSVAALPSSMNWSASLSLSLSRRRDRHWLLAFYDWAIGPTLAQSKGQGEGAAPEEEKSVTSYYLRDLKSRERILRSTWALAGGLSGARSDAEGYRPGWSIDESYEAKLTVPERLTLKVNAELKQSVDAATRVLDIGFLLSLNAVISF